MALRKALLVGINAYPGVPLRGCINDVNQMRGLLVSMYGFQDADCKLLLDADASLQGIQEGLQWLAQGGSESDAVRVFHYSGHGSFVADQNCDEPDGRDECLVPVDYKSAGMLIDDELKKLYDTFPKRANLTLVMDSCHSGGVQRDFAQDVVFRFIQASAEEFMKADQAAAGFRERQQEYVFQELKKADREALTDEELRRQIGTLMGRFEKKRFGDVRLREGNILLAGCRADQTSADARIEGDYHGAFTYGLVQTLKQANGNLSYRDLAAGTGDFLGKNNFAQVPQLEHARGRDLKPVFSPFA